MWIHPLIVEQKLDETHGRQIFSYHPSTGASIVGPTKRQGGIHTIRIRAVCTNCNSGWMNRLEVAARPIVTALALAEQITLNENDLNTLARWITVKCLVAEHDKPKVDVTPQSYRTAFMKDGKIPEFFRIYAVLNVSKSRIAYIRHTNCISLSDIGPVPPLDGATQNIQTISFLVGKVLFHLNAARIENFELEKRAIIVPVWGKCRIWPLQTVPMIWPRRPALDKDGIESVSSVLKRYIGVSKVRWGPLELP